MTTLQCGEWRCTRTTVNAFRDDRDWADKRGNKVKPRATLHNIRCNVHAGAMRRSRYQDDPLPLTDADRTRLLAEQAKVDAEERAKQDEQAIADDAADAKRHAAEWAFMDLTAEHVIEANTNRALFREEPTYEGLIWAGTDRPRNNWDSRWFSVEPSRRDYGRAGKRPYPYVVRVTRGSSLTPNEARALADALRAGADKAEELNKERRP